MKNLQIELQNDISVEDINFDNVRPITFNKEKELEPLRHLSELEETEIANRNLTAFKEIHEDDRVFF